MPVLLIECPDCGHAYQTLVLEGTKLPESWHCSKCDGVRARPRPDTPSLPHPWEAKEGHDPPFCACG